jgi:hypothetical protein
MMLPSSAQAFLLTACRMNDRPARCELSVTLVGSTASRQDGGVSRCGARVVASMTHRSDSCEAIQRARVPVPTLPILSIHRFRST